MFFCASEYTACRTITRPQSTDVHPIVSGQPPTNPVVAKSSGTVYEKALIERYIGKRYGYSFVVGADVAALRGEWD